MLQLLHVADKADKQLTEIGLPTLLRYLAELVDRKALRNRTSYSLIFLKYRFYHNEYATYRLGHQNTVIKACPVSVVKNLQCGRQ